MSEQIDMIMKLSSEVERLREALRKIDELYPLLLEMRETARAALLAPSLNEASEGLAPRSAYGGMAADMFHR